MADHGARPQNSAEAGGYVYADLGELDEVVGGWQNQGDNIRTDGALLADAYYGLRLSSSDVITANYFAALTSTLGDFYRHNEEMARYATGHVDALGASRQQTAETEDVNRAMLSRGEDG